MENKQKKKLMNFRIALILAVVIILSIILSVYLFKSEKSKLIFLFVMLGVTFISLILTIIFKKKFLVLILVCLVGFVLPIVSIYFKTVQLNKNASINVENYQIYGKIYTKKEDLDNKIIKLYLSDVKLVADNYEHKLSGDIFVYVATKNLDTSELFVGRYILVSSKVRLYSLQDEDLKKSASKLSSGVVGDSFAYAYNIKPTDKISKNLSDKLRANVLNKMYNIKHGDIGYAMLFGDTSVLDPDINGVFQNSGTAHLLSVSGFHVSLIVLMIAFVLRKLKANNYVKVSVIGAVLLFYMYICNFSVSVIRASLMAMLSLYATTRAKEYDNLSALSLAAVLLLLISPLELFNLSFILSFVSVLAIILIMPVLKRVFSKIFYDKFASIMALNIGVQIGLFVTQIYYFGNVPILSFLTNFITVPIVSFVFLFYIVGLLISFIMPFALPILNGFGVIMSLMLKFNNSISGINLVVSAGSLSVIAMALSIALMFMVSDYVFLKWKPKSIISVITLGIIVTLLLI